MKICILTIGTRGDVQPTIALGRGLMAGGHTVWVATLAEFKPLVEQYGLQHDNLRGEFLKAAGAAPGEAAARGPRNPLRMIREYVRMAADTLADEWRSAQEAEIFIYNPAAIGGYHIAERLGVPAFAAFPAPMYSPTRAFPSPFLPFRDLGPLNKFSHTFFAKMGPALYRRPIRAWREELGLPPNQGETMLGDKPVTRLYAYSEAVVPRPADWDNCSVVTGYWFLDSPDDWQPSPGLSAYLENGPPPVYVGFGSMFMQGGQAMTELAIQALKLAGQRGILATGWGGLCAAQVPDDFFVLDEAPHDWLFPRVTAVVHHGGAGTTGAALRAGKPAVICPFVGDQFFWGRRVAALGAGPAPIARRRLTAENLAEAIRMAVQDEGMRQRAADLGEVIRAEDGVGRAIEWITRQDSG